jgi:CDP-glucose 4,6-dehydratase
VEMALRWWPGKWHTTAEAAPAKEAKLLNLAIDKAARQLGWFPTWGLEEAIEQTIRWYYQCHVDGNPDMPKFTRQQINDFCRAAADTQQAWALA